mmetsp:Transcript_20296/g.44775  ORF Transcript_20296/g.44775 Transcript_20296/m.44775 type:complete len:111 (+) Transcript_20296:716-1048(+)
MTMLNILSPLLEVFFNIFGQEEMEESDEQNISLKFSMHEHEDQTRSSTFATFCEENRKVVNMIVRQKPVVLNEGFSVLAKKWFNLLEFDNKRAYFKMEIKKLKHSTGKVL